MLKHTFQQHWLKTPIKHYLSFQQKPGQPHFPSLFIQKINKQTTYIGGKHLLGYPFNELVVLLRQNHNVVHLEKARKKAHNTLKTIAKALRTKRHAGVRSNDGVLSHENKLVAIFRLGTEKRPTFHSAFARVRDWISSIISSYYHRSSWTDLKTASENGARWTEPWMAVDRRGWNTG